MREMERGRWREGKREEEGEAGKLDQDLSSDHNQDLGDLAGVSPVARLAGQIST